MKKLITLLLLIITSLGYSQKLTPKTQIEVFDTASIEYIKKLVVVELNEHRKKQGLTLLVWDERFKEPTDHHLYYLRATKFDGHTQHIDVPDFEELWDPYDRIKKFVPHTYQWTPHEVLLNALWTLFRESPSFTPLMQEIADKRNINRFSLEYFAMDIIERFKYSPAHWRALMDPDTHYMYVEIDILKKEYNTQCVVPIVLIFTGRDAIELNRTTTQERYHYHRNKEKFFGWHSKDIEDYYISKRETP